MQLLGHLALGYFSALIISRYTKEQLYLPLVWIISVLPDIDLLFTHYIIHRGPTHSIILALILFLPIFIWYHKGLAYFAALASHSLIGDFFY
jgi:membrane-bound metal-dependent hydrolase YbcI (DUF457 family)